MLTNGTDPALAIPKAWRNALGAARENGYKTVLDLCCGSGVAGVTLGAEGRFETVCFADSSGDALSVAREKRGRIDSAAGEKLRTGGFFWKRSDGRFDLVVCNPPYISAADYAELEPQVRTTSRGLRSLRRAAAMRFTAGAREILFGPERGRGARSRDRRYAGGARAFLAKKTAGFVKISCVRHAGDPAGFRLHGYISRGCLAFSKPPR